MSKTKPKAQGPRASGTQDQKTKRKPSTDKTTQGQASPPPRTTKDTDKSQSVPLVKTTTPQDLEGNIQPASRGAPSIVPHDGTEKHPSVLEGAKIGDRDSAGLKPPADTEPSPSMFQKLTLRTRQPNLSLLE